MKLTIQKKVLVPALERAARMADKKNAMPILRNVVIATENGRVTFSATDLYQSVLSSAECEGATPGGVCVSAGDIAKIIKAMPEGPLTLTVGKNHRAEIKSGKTRFTIPGMPAEDFPPLPMVPKLAMQSVDAKVLARVITATRYCALHDDTRPHLSCVNLHSANHGGAVELRSVATDGHRLAISSAPMPELAPLSALIPTRGVPEILALCEANAAVSLGVASSMLYVEAGDTALSFKLADEQFPPYAKVIPDSFKMAATVPRELLIAAVKRIALVVADRAGGVKLTFTADDVTVTGEHPDLGEGSETVACVYTGAPLSLGANHRYLLEALSVVREDDVRIEMSGELEPIVVRGHDNAQELGVIMPTRLG